MSATFAQRLRRGDRMVGTFVAVSDLALAEILAAQMDLLVVDLEHGAVTVADLQAVAVAAHGRECAVLARVPDPGYEGLAAVLDAGVAGIVAPRVDSVDTARQLASRLRYPPQGSRGYGPRRANSYGARPEYWRAPEAEVACLAQIESVAGLEAVEGIAAVDGVDCLLLGPADLSFDLGAPLELNSAEIRDAAGAIQSAARRNGTAFAIASNSTAEALRGLADQTCSVLIQGVDVRIYSEAVFETASRARAALAALEAPPDEDELAAPPHGPGRAMRPAN